MYRVRRGGEGLLSVRNWPAEYSNSLLPCLDLVIKEMIDLSKEKQSSDDFEQSPFIQRGGLGKARQLFGTEWPTILQDLNERLAA